MTITYPLNVLADFPGTTPRFELSYNQELSPLRGGRQNAADLGPALWEMDVKSRIMRPSQLRYWKARLAALENGVKELIGYDMAAFWPIAYPRGSWPVLSGFDGVASLASVDTDNKTIALEGLPEGFKVSTGDYVSFDYGSGPSRALHQAMEDAVADGDGLTSGFEVRPHIRTGFTVGADVALTKPHAVMLIIPGSVSAPSDDTLMGSISFSARQTV